MKKRGMINPLLCIETQECEGQKYKCCLGNNRYLAAHELGIKEVPIKQKPTYSKTLKLRLGHK